MDRHCADAARVARMLADHPAVESVLYPGLPGHGGHEVAKSQMRDFGGMVSFRLRAGEQQAVDVCARTRLFTLGESLGGVESLICLLYTSDAADDLLCVDLGGRRIIKKKKKKERVK